MGDREEADDYLDEGFDPQALKMSALRNLLVRHDVAYPSNAKKSELVEILQRRVLSKRSRLRKEARKQKKTRGDGRDIEQVAGTSAAGVGSRTRSQTPRADRTRPPMFTQTDKTKDGGIEKKTKKAKVKKTKTKKQLEKAAAQDEKAVAQDEKAVAQDEKAAVKDEKATAKDEKPATKDKKPEPVPSRARDELGKAADVKRGSGTKRKLSDAEHSGSAAGDSGDEELFTPKRGTAGVAQRRRIAKRREQMESGDSSDEDGPRGKAVVSGDLRAPRKGSGGGANFSDENPFQSSPEMSRKRRRKAAGSSGMPTTPMSALRKSQTSEVSFKVSLPRGAEVESSDRGGLRPGPERTDDEADRVEEEASPVLSPERARVSDLVAKYQQQQPASPPRSPTVRIRDGLKRQPEPSAEPVPEPESVANPVPEPVFEPIPAPVVAPRGRFTMTPDALRQMAEEKQSEDRQAAARQQQAARRRTTAGSGLPPVAPGIVPTTRGLRRPPSRERVAAPVLAAEDRAEIPSLEQADREAQGLQRRRVATLRQHVEEAGGAQRHLRRSSIASIASTVSEERGVEAVPAARPAPSTSTKSRPWTRLAWLGVAGAAALVLRAHTQFSIGFGSTRADYAPLAPPADSILAQPAPLEDAETASLAERAIYYAHRARAWAAPPALECPEHAECVPYTAIPADAAADTARDQWVVDVRGAQRVAVVQCDAGYVLHFPPLASRLVPRVPTCVRDASTAQRVAQLVAAMLRECRVRRGRAECDMSLLQQARSLIGSASAAGATEDDADEIERLGLSAAELRRAMYARKAPRLSDAEFEAVFALALDELASGDDVSHYVLAYEDDEDEDADAEMPFYVARGAEYRPLCYIQRMALGLVLGNLPGLLAVVGMAVAAFVAHRRLTAHRAEVQAADALVASALARLKRQARRHYVDPALSPSPAIPSLQLRDLLLLSSSSAASTPGAMSPVRGPTPQPAYYDPRARTSVWERVRRVVERNANVRCRTTAVRGEPMRVWEWIGPLDEDDDDAAVFSS
ncbi:hypothetical protein GGF46_002107 [Coemansia sp. RSA 552]|nr:hypothetical protein GGF46_002107 [Coemansia sp. RSA 552]